MGGQGARSQSSESTFILCRHQGFSPYKARGWKPHRFVGWSRRGFIAQCFCVNRLLRSYLANIALHGLEEDTKEALLASLKRTAKPFHWGSEKTKKTLHIIRYADDFVVIHKDLSIVQEAEQHIATWLGRMGL